MKIGIAKAHLTGGQIMDFSDEGEIYILTGSNNSGKTSFLKEAYRSLNGLSLVNPVVINRTELYKFGTVDELMTRLLQKGVRNGSQWNFGSISFQSTFENFFKSEGIGLLESVLASQLTTTERLNLANPAPSIDFHSEPKIYPLQHLHRSSEKRQVLARYFKRAFGSEIAMDMQGSKVIPLHVGNGAEAQGDEDVISDGYLNRLRALPRLEEQGDGMRSFVGIILNVLFGNFDIVFLDEPEAFLHPPQARLLGSILVQERPHNMQLFISTHSADFIRGCLDADTSNIRIARIRRVSTGARVDELPKLELRESWADPVLRFSNVIEGLFHEKVVVCEADGDCRFYAAIAEALRRPEQHPYVRDLMFAQAGGKGGVPKLINALKALSVPVVAVVDFDIFSQVGQLSAIINGLGGDYAIFREDINTVRSDIESLGPRPSSSEAKSNLLKVLETIDEDADLPRDIEKRIRTAIKTAPGWIRAKSSGAGMLSRKAQPIGERLLQGLREIGLFIVPVGEIESFEPSITSDKNQWINSVLEIYRDDIGTTPALANARTFVSGFIGRNYHEK